MPTLPAFAKPPALSPCKARSLWLTQRLAPAPSGSDRRNGEMPAGRRPFARGRSGHRPFASGRLAGPDPRGDPGRHGPGKNRAVAELPVMAKVAPAEDRPRGVPVPGILKYLLTAHPVRPRLARRATVGCHLWSQQGRGGVGQATDRRPRGLRIQVPPPPLLSRIPGQSGRPVGRSFRGCFVLAASWIRAFRTVG